VAASRSARSQWQSRNWHVTSVPGSESGSLAVTVSRGASGTVTATVTRDRRNQERASDS
jgi:hypothetical protein